MVEHPTDLGNDTRHLRSGTDIQVHQNMMGSNSASSQSADILNLSEEAICKEYNLDPNKIRVDLEHLFNNISDIVNILAPKK